jgi:uncharacterized repeat protein (TIGR01451 family)
MNHRRNPTLRRSVTAILSATVFIAGMGLTSTALAQDAPTGTVSITGPATHTAGQALSYAVNYTLTGANMSSTLVTVTLPVGVNVTTAVGPDGVNVVCTGSWTGTGVTCVFDLGLANGGVSGQGTITGALQVGFQLDGATMTATETLTADYALDAGGTAAMTPVVDTQDTVVSANAVPSVLTDQITNIRWLQNPNTSEVGLSWEYRIRAYSGGTARLEPGWTLTNDIDSKLTFVEWSENGIGFTEVSAPAAWTVGDLELTHNAQLTSGSRYVYVKVWIGCDDLALLPNSLMQNTALAGNELKSSGLVAKTASHSYTAVPTAAEGVCGTGGGSGKSSNPSTTIGEGENVTWSIGVTSPNGAVQVDDAVVVDRIPAGTTFVSASAGSPTDFTLYYCVVPAETGNFTRTQFTTSPNYKTNGCTTTAPVDLTTVTHIVWHAAAWGNATDGIGAFSGSLVTNVPYDVYDHGHVITNTALAEGAYDFNGVSAYSFEPVDTITVRTDGETRIATYQLPWAANFEPRSHGDELTIYAWSGSNWGGARIRNPTVTLLLPPELEVIEGLAPEFRQSGCVWDSPIPTVYSATPSIENLGTGETSVTWTFGSDAAPVRLPFDCTTNGGGSVTSRPLYTGVRVRIKPSAELVNGQNLPYSGTATGDNSTNTAAAAFIVPISIPAEMRTDVQPDCTDDTEPLPSLLVTYENSGGEPLTDLNVTVAVPKLGDGSGTEVDTTFVRTESAPAGTSFEYLVGATWQATIPGDLTTVNAVRLLQNSTLEPNTGVNSFNVVVSVPGSTPTGTFIRGSSLMSGDPLSDVASADSAPIKVNLCPGVLGVHVFYDANGNGTQDSGEPDLPDWDVVTTDVVDTDLVLNWTTDANGNYSQQVSPATYEVVVTHPTSGAGATWTSNPVQGTVLTGQTTSLLVPVTCSCASDGDACTSDACDATGQCAYAASGPLVGVADDTCDGVDNDCDNSTDEDYDPTATTCGDGVCASTGETTCVAGTLGDTCVEGTPDSDVDDDCNGEDNNCNGTVDSGFMTTDTFCGTGACEAMGQLTCDSSTGTISDSCTAGTPGIELCDLVDGDCDGVVNVAANGDEPCGTTPGTGTPLTTPDGTLICVQNPLNGTESGVTTSYTNVNRSLRFCHQFNGVAATTPFPTEIDCIYPD